MIDEPSSSRWATWVQAIRDDGAIYAQSDRNPRDWPGALTPFESTFALTTHRGFVRLSWENVRPCSAKMPTVIAFTDSATQHYEVAVLQDQDNSSAVSGVMPGTYYVSVTRLQSPWGSQIPSCADATMAGITVTEDGVTDAGHFVL